MDRNIRAALCRTGIALGICAGVLLIAALLLAATTLVLLRAGPADWSVRVGSARFGADLSVPALIRVATHPLGMRALAGRSVDTRFGRIVFSAAPPGPRGPELVATCAPCTIDARALDARPVRVGRVVATIARHTKDDLYGRITLDAVPLRWRLRLEGQAADIELGADAVPMANVVALFGPALADLRRARIGGHAGVEIRVALPSGRFAIAPRLEGLSVDGLGAEALLGVTPQPACARVPRRGRGAPASAGWVAKAVLAAEDQRFFEHPGYDLDEMAAAWSGAAAPGQRRRGASTLTQQLAKLLYTGDERTMARKLRELLHAADLERALGKARVLDLYLAIAPWGDGRCGAEAAAWHYFGRPASALGAAEAVWLASLLRNPAAELALWARPVVPSAGNARLATIAHGVRPLTRTARMRLVAEVVRLKPPPGVSAMRPGLEPEPTASSQVARAR